MYLTVYPKGQADLDNQRPDKWSSTAQWLRGNSDFRVARTILNGKWTQFFLLKLS